MQAESEGRICADRNVCVGRAECRSGSSGRWAGSGIGSDPIVKSLWFGETRREPRPYWLSSPPQHFESPALAGGVEKVGRGSGAWILALPLPLRHAISLGLRSLPYKIGMNKKKNSSYHSLSHRSMPGTFLNLTDNCCTKSSQQQLVVVLFPFQMRKQAQQG